MFSSLVLPGFLELFLGQSGHPLQDLVGEGGGGEFGGGNKAHQTGQMVRPRPPADPASPSPPQKTRRNDPERLVLRKYDPMIRRHVDFREER